MSNSEPSLEQSSTADDTWFPLAPDDDGSEAGMSQTDWSLIDAAAQHRKDETPAPQTELALEQLARRYWPAIYAFIRAGGRDVDESSDLTQGFICDVILSRRLLQIADPKRGRFRSLLMTAVENYLHEDHRKNTAQKRSHEGRPPVQIEHAHLLNLDRQGDLSPQKAYAAQWSATLVRRVLDDVREACRIDDLEPHWRVFEARVAKPLLFGDEPLPYEELVQQLDLEDASQASNMMVTVKRRFSRALRQEVARTVRDPNEIEDELKELLSDLERPS